MKNWKIILIIFVALVIGMTYYFYVKYFKPKPIINLPQIVKTSEQVENETIKPIVNESLSEPIADFKKRITKKPFGIYITPENSPVEKEKYIGYHTGVDVEYEDILVSVPVYAISEGTVEYRGNVSGYGGVVVISSRVENKNILCLYGHLNLKDSPSVGDKVSKGDIIASLGEDGSTETAGERKHLHFGLIKVDKIDFRGYVSKNYELDGWYNPLDFF